MGSKQSSGKSSNLEDEGGHLDFQYRYQIQSCPESVLQLKLNFETKSYQATTCGLMKLSLKGAISPVSPVNLSTESREKAGIPLRAVSFVWAYPDETLEKSLIFKEVADKLERTTHPERFMTNQEHPDTDPPEKGPTPTDAAEPQEPTLSDPTEPQEPPPTGSQEDNYNSFTQQQLEQSFIWNDIPELKFAMYGGFVYLSPNGNVIGVNPISDSEGGGDLLLDGPFVFQDKYKIDALVRNGRFQTITLQKLQTQSIKRYCWLLPNEKYSDGSVICTHGAFIYEHDKGYFFFSVKDATQAVWEWKEKNVWIAYGTKTSKLLEKQYSHGEESIVLNDGFYSKGPYTIDFTSMQQKNTKTNFTRDIRRTYCTSSETIATWECLVKKTWKPYEANTNRMLEMSYVVALSGGDVEMKLMSGIVSDDVHMINFDEMVQKNVSTGFDRPIRRVVDVGLESEIKRIPLAKRTMLMRSRVGCRLISSEQLVPCHGLLSITIKGGSNLGGSEPFVVVTTDFSSKRFQTKPIKSATPLWDETFTILISNDSQIGTITFTFYNHKTLTKELYLGKLSVLLHDVISAGTEGVSGWKRLDYERRRNDAAPAAINLVMTFATTEKPSHIAIPTLSSLLTEEAKQHVIMARRVASRNRTSVSASHLSVSQNLKARSTPSTKEGTEKTLWTIRHKILEDVSHPNVLQGYHGTYEIQLGKFLGKGAGGQVNLGRNIQSNESVAVKLMTKDYIDTERGAAKIRELQMLHTMTHPYIISVIESIEIPDAFYIIMELGRGDLMHKLEEGIHDTAQAKRVAMNLFSALEYLHSIGICHRDVKPENLLCCQGPRGEEAWKLGDFGIAIFFTEEDPYITGNIGTPDYMAPEIFLDQKYTKEVDLWAAGVTLFSALTAQSPWAHTNPQAKQHAILIGEVSWHQETWDAIDPNAKDLVEKLIVRDPQERPSPEACLRHKWLIV